MRSSFQILGTGGVLCFLALSAWGQNGGQTKPPPAPQVSTLSLPNGTASQAYRGMLIVIGGTKPYKWSLAGGSLPPGLRLNDSGAITGTPCGDSGTWWATFQVKDAKSLKAKKSLSILIGFAPLQITTTALSKGNVGVPYLAKLEARAGVPRCP